MSLVSMTRKTRSLADPESVRGLSPSSSPPLGATSDSTFAVSKEAYPKHSATERHTLHPPRATDYLVEDSEAVGNEMITPLPE
ncbi:hypothetical protein Plhal304r1_c022g0076411 [Plasmopara halstedii]